MIGTIVGSVAVALVADALLDPDVRRAIRLRVRARRRLRSVASARRRSHDSPETLAARESVRVRLAAAETAAHDAERFASNWTIGPIAMRKHEEAQAALVDARKQLAKLERTA